MRPPPPWRKRSLRESQRQDLTESVSPKLLSETHYKLISAACVQGKSNIIDTRKLSATPKVISLQCGAHRGIFECFEVLAFYMPDKITIPMVIA